LTCQLVTEWYIPDCQNPSAFQFIPFQTFRRSFRGFALRYPRRAFRDARGMEAKVGKREGLLLLAGACDKGFDVPEVHEIVRRGLLWATREESQLDSSGERPEPLRAGEFNVVKPQGH
jgi:hypothetical protein